MSGALRISPSSVEASAILQADSTTQGFLPPRMTTTQRDAISSPATGLFIYNTTTGAYNWYTGSAWVVIGGSGGSVGAPASSTDNGIARWDGTTGTLLQNSTSTLDDNGALVLQRGAVLNESGADSDTRIEGDTDQNLIVADASTDRVGIGTATPTAKLNVEGAVIFNDAGADVDVRVEGDTDQNLLFVDASTDRVGIGTATPATKLDVNGTVTATAGVLTTATATKLVLAATTELTIASGAVTATQSVHTVDTEADAASDDLDTINGATANMLLIIRADDAARTVVVKHNTGNILCSGGTDLTLDETYKEVWLRYDNALSKWIARGG